MTDNVTGTVEFVAPKEKGFGFIRVEGYDKQLFFHAKHLNHVSFEQVRKGDKVTIGRIEKTNKGFNAFDVCLIS